MLITDISSHQADYDFNKMLAAGFEATIIKVTGGNLYKNPLFADQFARAGAAGVERGIYHYDGEPTVRSGTPRQEAEHFLSNLPDPLPDGVPLFHDEEERATRDPERYLQWLEIVEQHTGRKPMPYTFQSFVTEIGADAWAPLQDYDLWYAWYPFNRDNIEQHPWPVPPAPWMGGAKLWQFSGGMTIPGFTFPTDASIFRGTREDFRNLGLQREALAIGLPPRSILFGPFNAHLGGGFRDFYEAAGPNALAYFGYPMDEEHSEGGLTVQNFQRARFEWHHDHVELGLVNAERLGRV